MMLAKTTHKGKKGLETVITLSEGSQRQSSITDMWNLTWYKPTDLQNQKQTHRLQKQTMVTRGEGGEG